MRKMEDIKVKQVLSIIWQKALLIILTTALFGGAAFAYTYFCVTPEYTASITLYVNNSTEGDTNTISSSDLTVARSLVDTYVAIIKSDSVLERVAADSGAGVKASDIVSMISAGAVSNTEIFKVSVSNASPETAAAIANAIAAAATDAIAEIVEGSSVKIVDYASVPGAPSYPDYKINIAIGLTIGFVFIVAVVLIAGLLDVRIKSEEDLEEMFDIPVLGVIPVLNQVAKSGSGYGYGADGKRRA